MTPASSGAVSVLAMIWPTAERTSAADVHLLRCEEVKAARPRRPRRTAR